VVVSYRFSVDERYVEIAIRETLRWFVIGQSSFVIECAIGRTPFESLQMTNDLEK
jgi:hypothetical protein